MNAEEDFAAFVSLYSWETKQLCVKDVQHSPSENENMLKNSN